MNFAVAKQSHHLFLEQEDKYPFKLLQRADKHKNLKRTQINLNNDQYFKTYLLSKL